MIFISSSFKVAMNLICMLGLPAVMSATRSSLQSSAFHLPDIVYALPVSTPILLGMICHMF